MCILPDGSKPSYATMLGLLDAKRLLSSASSMHSWAKLMHSATFSSTLSLQNGQMKVSEHVVRGLVRPCLYGNEHLAALVKQCVGTPHCCGSSCVSYYSNSMGAW